LVDTTYNSSNYSGKSHSLGTVSHGYLLFIKTAMHWPGFVVEKVYEGIERSPMA